jgi:hypothetical protein
VNSGTRVLIAVGILLILAGLGWQLGGRQWGIGHLPGDITWTRGNMRFYLPIGTSLLFSLIVTLALWIFRR